MAEQFFFFDSTEGDEREYSQAEMSAAFKHATAANGVSGLGYDDPLLAGLQPDGSVIVQPGVMGIEGFWYENDAPLKLTPTGFLQGQVRTDLVVVRLDKAAGVKAARAQIVRGTDGSSTPPPLLREGNGYDLCVARIVFDGATATLTDTRHDPALCGFIGQQYATAGQGETADTAAASLAELREQMGLPPGSQVLAVAHGGTGGHTPAQARSNLGALHKAGDTMTGPLVLSGAPTADNGAATKQYVDEAVKGGRAASADKLTTARKLATSGGATGTATLFDGTSDITIPITGLDMGKANAGVLPVERGGTGTAQQGAGSGFDADKLDGYDAAYFAAADTAFLKADVVNNLTTTAAGLALDARQGKALSDGLATKLPSANLANNLTATAAGYALDARQGKALKDYADGKKVRTDILWSGTWSTGSITIANLDDYRLFEFIQNEPDNALGSIVAIGVRSGNLLFVYAVQPWTADGAGVYATYISVSGNTLTWQRGQGIGLWPAGHVSIGRKPVTTYVQGVTLTN